jgi:two-component system, NarL family, sensor kinase
MQRTLLITVVTLLICHWLEAQPLSKKDSLLHVLQSAKEDTSKIKLLLNIEKLYANKNYDSFYYYLDKANTLSKKLETDKFDFFINAGYSEYFYFNNDYEKSIAYALASKDIAEKQNDLKLQAKSYNNLAAVYNHFGKYKYAIDCILKCLNITEKTKDSVSFPVRNLTASNSYFNLEQFDKSILHAKRAIRFGKRFDNAFAVAMGLNNLSASYSALNMLDSSVLINEQQLELAKQEEDIVNINYALINLCFDNFKLDNKVALEKYAKELTANYKMLPDSQTIAQVYNAITLHLMSKQKYGVAKTKLDSGINIAKSVSNPDALATLYQTGSILYYLQGNIKEGENYSFKYDSLMRASNLKDLNFYTEELEKKYETKKKETQLTLQEVQLRQKSTLNYFLMAGAVVLAIILLLSFRNYKHHKNLQQTKIDELETEKRLTATEAVLKGEEQERTRLAKDLHDGLGGMLSGIKFSLNNVKENLVMTPDNAHAFERSIDMLDSSIKEMRRVAHNMMPEVLLKYGLDVALKEYCAEIERSGVMRTTYQSINMDKIPMSQSTAVTIYRIVQELSNNTIKHANATDIIVQAHISVPEKLLTVTVEDNGKGFDSEILKQSSGMGWSNIQNRVEFLKGKIDVNSEKGKGTSVLIEVNI